MDERDCIKQSLYYIGSDSVNYAKSKPKETLKEHTEALLDGEKVLEELYKEKVRETPNLEKERLWELLKIAATYHDVGKVYTPFQNVLLSSWKEKLIPTRFRNDIRHEKISPALIPMGKFDLSQEEKKLLIQAVYYHHERNDLGVDKELLEEVLKEDILPRIEEIEKELGIELEHSGSTRYLGKIGERRRINSESEWYLEYCILKGLLHRLDHSASAHVVIEDDTKEKVSDYVEKFIKEKGYDLNEIQIFAKENRDKNIILIGSTGMGKTEMALLWSEQDKTFFTLPIRISINAIFSRIQKLGYEHVGLLHSSSLDYLESEAEIQCPDEIYKQSQNLYYKITTSTIDQIFTFVFKYKGYEKMYATLAYSKVIIDEIQAYSPEIVAILLKGLEMIHKIGGKFLIMTATLPRIYKEKLEEMGVPFAFKTALKEEERHCIRLKQEGILKDIEQIKKVGEEKKVLVIVNTINRAIEVYSELKRRGMDNIKMLHSRFIAEDRNGLENEIIEFSKAKGKAGIWITTQIVEASLDIDFDMLFTEMSTLDSLFQRLGRCYRSRSYEKKEPNIFIYTKEITGIGYVYDKDIHQKSIELLQSWDGKILEEKVKVDLVDRLYSKEILAGTDFLKKFESGMEFLNNMRDYETDKAEAQKLLRNIDNITVIPKDIYDENVDLFDGYKELEKWEDRKEVRRKIERLVTTITKSQERKIRERLSSTELEDVYKIDMKYDSQMGLILEKDEEYEINSRFFE